MLIFKRIIALLLAFCLVFSLCFSSFAVSSEDQATFWESWLAYLAGQNDHWSFLDGTGTFDMLGSLLSRDTVCGQSSDGYHHGTQIDSLVDGRAKVKCSECGEWFYYSASDLQNQYNNTIQGNNLDNGLATTPDGGFYWYPSLSDLSDLQVYAYKSAPYYRSILDSRSGTFVYVPSSNATIYRYSASDSGISFSFTSNGAEYPYYYYVVYSFVVPVSGSYSSLPFTSSWSGNQDLNYGVSGSFSFKSGKFSGSFSRSSVFSCTVNPDQFGSGRLQGSAFIPIPAFSVVPSDSVSTPSVPTTININNNIYNVTDIVFNTRIIHTDDDKTIIYDDDKIIIQEGDTIIEEHNYYIEDDDPDPGPGGDDSSTDPGVDPGDGSGGSGCCEQCALLLRQVNSYLLQIQTLVDQINDKLGPESDNYMEGIYNLLVEINTALDNLPTEPHKDYEAKLTTICNQLSNIWGDLETIKTSLSAVETNTATTNEKLDTVHADLQAVLAELQTQRGILSQILSVLRDMLGHITSIDSNVEELANEEDSQNFFDSFILKFHFIGDIFSIIRQLFADITNDAATVTFVDNGDLPIGDLSSRHFPVSGSPVPVGTAPQILIKFSSATYHGADLSGYSAIDMSWYAPYKSRVDALISGFLWIGYLWLLFKRAPGIVRGAAMIEETNYKIEDWKNGG